MTTGWAEEKKQWKKELVDRTLEQIKERQAIDNANALVNILNILTAFKLKISTEQQIRNLPVADIVKMWEVFRTENSLPTRYTHNTNENTNFDAEKVREELLAKMIKH